MCFSATVSFAVSAFAGVIGIAALKQTSCKREMPLAAVPLLFGVQQLLEGLLWLQLPAGEGSCSVAALSFGFLAIAEAVWPAYIAVAVLLVESDKRREYVLVGLAALGVVISRELLLDLIMNPPEAFIRGRSIAYSGDPSSVTSQQLPYLISTVAPLFISSHRAVRTFGAFVAAGFVASAYAYAETFSRQPAASSYICTSRARP